MLKSRTREENDTAIVDRPPISSSVIPAIDLIVGEMAARELVSGMEIVDRLLDLRMIALADEVLANAR